MVTPLDNQENRVIGIDIGGTFIKFALMNSLGVIDRKWSIPTNISEKGRFIPEEICFSIRKMLGEDSLKIVTGIGIGVPGPISPDGKMVVQAVNLDWKDLPLREMIENDLGIGVCLLNDANAAALGEMWQGAAKGNKTFCSLH